MTECSLLKRLTTIMTICASDNMTLILTYFTDRMPLFR